MAFEFKLPDIGEGVTEGEIVKWLVKAGDTVQEDQPIVEVMTDKATVEIASPRAGKIAKVNGNEGQLVPVGHVLVHIDESGAAPKENAKASSKEESNAQVVSISSKKEPSAGLFSASVPPPRQAPSPTPTASGAGAAQARVLASPATRKLAREKGIDLGSIQGSGPNGRVTREDLERGAFSRSAGNTALAAKPQFAMSKPYGSEERVPLRGIRKRIAEHLVHSKHTAPHFTQFEEVDFTNLVDVRHKANALLADRGVKISYLPFIIQALCRALLRYPQLNATLEDEKAEIVYKYYFNVGIAVDTPDGLVVPVIKSADQKSISELAREVVELAEKARTGRLAPDDLKGGTITITSTGAEGGLMATPIINHPEVAILGVNRFRDAPVVRDGAIAIRKIGHISLSLDHRVVDGAVSARFLKELVSYLENPALLLLDT